MNTLQNDESTMEDVEKQGTARDAEASRSLEPTTTNPYFGDREHDADYWDEESPPVEQATSSRASSVKSAGLTQWSSRASAGIRKRETALSKIRSRAPISNFSHPLEHDKTSVDDLVDFKGADDPYHPVNWAMKKKVVTTALYGFTTMAATWASASYSAGQGQISEEFHVGSQVATLGTTLFLFGFGLGPLLWAPLSEVFGRKMAVIPPMFIGACFSFGTATAKDIQTIMITRFFSAFFCSAPVTNTGGVLADLFPPSQRGIAIASYAMAVVIGPVFGPIVGAAVTVQPSLGWRWTEYLVGIIQCTMAVLDIVFIDESYPPKLLVVKAQQIRHQSGNWALHAKFEEWDISLSELAHKFMVRPFQLLMTPICAMMCLYASFCYGILYMQLGAIPIIFGEQRHWKLLPAELPFLALMLGAIAGAAVNVFNQFNYNKKAAGRVIPELRLLPMMPGSFAFAAGMFIVGWTGPPENAPWIAPCIGIFMCGLGFFTIFQAALNYLVDTFQRYAASAVAANTLLRSCFAGAFPLVVGPLYHNVGVPWGTSIFAFFAVVLIPIPFLLYRFGERVRGQSKWSRESVEKQYGRA